MDGHTATIESARRVDTDNALELLQRMRALGICCAHRNIDPSGIEHDTRRTEKLGSPLYGGLHRRAVRYITFDRDTSQLGSQFLGKLPV